MSHAKTVAKSSGDPRASINSDELDTARTIALYCAGTDSERDQIEADRPKLITATVRRQAELVRPGPQRTWMTVGAEYTTPKRRSDVLRAIASLDWHEVGEDNLDVPAMPGLAIQACITELRIPRVSQIAWHGSANTVDWYDRDRKEGQHYAIYGIQGHYTNGLARLYVIDRGTTCTPLVSDFWPELAAA